MTTDRVSVAASLGLPAEVAAVAEAMLGRWREQARQGFAAAPAEHCEDLARLAVAALDLPGRDARALERERGQLTSFVEALYWQTAVPASWGAAVEATIAHCGHLGIDVDEMAALLSAERDTSG
jgi:hypothetical protein